MYKIEKGIALPQGKAKKQTIYPFAQMEVGDSFFVEGKTIANVSSSAVHHALKSEKKFSVRKENGGVRCWRIK